MSWISERTDESRDDAPSKSPYAPEASTALERLGLRPDAPLRLSSAAYSRMLPIAGEAGYHTALRRAFGTGEAKPRDADSQLTWLAQHLRLHEPTPDDPWPWWENAWTTAAAEANVRPPQCLDVRSTRALLDELLTLPDYPSRLADALAVAFKRQPA